jgi:hypothetical protein
MTASDLPIPDVFLSSAFMKFMDERAKIVAIDKSRVLAVEIERPDLDTRKGVPQFVIVDALVEQIRKSKGFICVLRDWYGSSVFENAESVSFLETEIYEAALFHNNVHFFLMEPFNPDPRLKGLLRLVNAIRPGIHRATGSSYRVKSCLLTFLGNLAKHFPQHLHHIAAENLADAFGRIVSSSEFSRQIFPVQQLRASASLEKSAG